jgi:hypothetical protein
MSSPRQGLSKAVSCSQAVACQHYANKHLAIAWAEKGIHPEEVADGSFQYARIGSVGPGGFLNWGLIEMRADQMKRTKNSRKMHMVFNVQSGVVEVRVHENEFTVHRGGIWQVPRGELFPSPTCFILRFLSYLLSSFCHFLPGHISQACFGLGSRQLTDAGDLRNWHPGTTVVGLCSSPARRETG